MEFIKNLTAYTKNMSERDKFEYYRTQTHDLLNLAKTTSGDRRNTCCQEGLICVDKLSEYSLRQRERDRRNYENLIETIRTKFYYFIELESEKKS